MPHWITSIDVHDIHEAYQSGAMPIQDVAKKLAERLKKNYYFSQLQDLIEALETVSDLNEYDAILAKLYDFGDVEYRIFFNPFPIPSRA